jgi:hypothetical protein
MNPPGCSSLRTALITSPVTGSTTIRQPRSRTGRAHPPAAAAITCSCSRLSTGSGRRGWSSLIAASLGGRGEQRQRHSALLGRQMALMPGAGERKWTSAMSTGRRPCRVKPVNGRPSLPGCDQVRCDRRVSPAISCGAADALRHPSCGAGPTMPGRDTRCMAAARHQGAVLPDSSHATRDASAGFPLSRCHRCRRRADGHAGARPARRDRVSGRRSRSHNSRRGSPPRNDLARRVLADCFPR